MTRASRFVALTFYDSQLGITDIPALIDLAYRACNWFAPARDLGDSRIWYGLPDIRDLDGACECAEEIVAEFLDQQPPVDADIEALFEGEDDPRDQVPIAATLGRSLIAALSEPPSGAPAPSPAELIRAITEPSPLAPPPQPASGSRQRQWSARELLAAVMLLQCDRATAAIRAAALADVTAYLVDVAELHAAIAQTFEADRTQQQKRLRVAELNIARHARTREARQLVTEDWLADRTQFPSADAASRHYLNWLEIKGFSISNPRTIAGWIRETARSSGIKLR
jgi:hypothetical protein